MGQFSVLRRHIFEFCVFWPMSDRSEKMEHNAMQPCLYVHPDNVRQAKQSLALEAAVIARPDDFLRRNQCKQIIVETEKGVHTRCFIGTAASHNFLIIYGRFDRVRKVSSELNYELTQDVISFLGIDRVVGTFSVGSVKEEDPSGTVFVPHDLIGFGNFSNTRRRESGFRNVDSFRPFCDPLRAAILDATLEVDFPVRTTGVYACFHGFPRIETLAELNSYAAMGCDVIGQTLDPEATLAREAGCHYAAIAATIDDHVVRERFLKNDHSAREVIDQNILEGRLKTFGLFLKALPKICSTNLICNCIHQGDIIKRKRNLFYYRPGFLKEGAG